VTYNLGGEYKELYANGTLGPTVTSATLRNAEGKIYIPIDGIEQDTVPPGRILDLGAAPGVTQGSLELSWSATGDDAYEGKATGVEIYYSLSPINPGTLYEANAVAGPIPSPSGSSETFTLTDLRPGYQYYLAIRAYDNGGNRSELAEFPFTFAGGLRSPAPLVTSVDSLSATATIWCTAVPSYHPSVLYEFEVDTTTAFRTPTIVPPAEISDTAVKAVYEPVEQGYTYFWRCRASNATKSTASTWSGFMVFHYASGTTAALTRDHMTGPYEGQIVTSSQPTLEVAAVPNVTQVYFQVDDNGVFSSPLQSSAVSTKPDSSTTWQVPLQLTDGYDWHWRASSDGVLWTEPVQFTIFGGFATGSDDLIPAHVYPNPFRTNERDFVTFTLIPRGANLAIMTVSGELVRTWSDIAAGELTWDGTTEAGNHVASGVYLWFIENYKMKGKIVVIR
jgi:hypothetical protein